MPIRSRAAGILDDSELTILEDVLARLVSEGKADLRDDYAVRLIQLFQSGFTDPDDLVERVKSAQRD
jgi:starvation-inducible outer membrane lipoprotein